MRWLRPMRQDLSRWLYHREGKERSGIKKKHGTVAILHFPIWTQNPFIGSHFNTSQTHENHFANICGV